MIMGLPRFPPRITRKTRIRKNLSVSCPCFPCNPWFDDTGRPMPPPTRRFFGPRFLALFLAALLTGCATNRPLDRALLAHNAQPSREVTEGYRVQCPDVLEVATDFRPDIPSGRRVVGAD